VMMMNLYRIETNPQDTTRVLNPHRTRSNHHGRV
jgi:hypothetical protein